ncbi:MAG: branched chain amino acid aminotransferase, partial [Clostridia bacterium]|nr:branched chain amino acid aminotransferase [Clostridia bacterium]
MEIKITKTQTPKAKQTEKLGFGKIFTDHMFVVDYERGKGWFNARIIPFENLNLHPAATVFHYGAEIFEGLKAYRTADGSVQLFRPIENVRRMNNSAERIGLPQMPEEDMLSAILEFVKVEKDWVPYGEGESLYLRPFMFGNDEH